MGCNTAENKAVVVGTNEAGLAAARELVEQGYSVVVFEPKAMGHVGINEQFEPKTPEDRRTSEAAAETLRELGADVRVLTDPSRTAISLVAPEVVRWCIDDEPAWLDEVLG